MRTALSVNRYGLQCLILSLILFLFSIAANANDPAYDFQKANELYQKQNYDSAAKIYEKLIGQEYYSADDYVEMEDYCTFSQDWKY